MPLLGLKRQVQIMPKSSKQAKQYQNQKKAMSLNRHIMSFGYVKIQSYLLLNSMCS